MSGKLSVFLFLVILSGCRYELDPSVLLEFKNMPGRYTHDNEIGFTCFMKDKDLVCLNKNNIKVVYNDYEEKGPQEVYAFKDDLKDGYYTKKGKLNKVFLEGDRFFEEIDSKRFYVKPFVFVNSNQISLSDTLDISIILFTKKNNRIKNFAIFFKNEENKIFKKTIQKLKGDKSAFIRIFDFFHLKGNYEICVLADTIGVKDGYKYQLDSTFVKVKVN